MPWRPLGMLLPAPPPLPWSTSHVALPAVEQLDDGRIRVYFSSRDAEGRSRIGTVDVELREPSQAPRFRADPLVELGPLGAFDDSGTTMSCVVVDGDRRFVYYSGWTLGRTVPFTFFAGCAVSEDGGVTFAKVSPAPILDRSSVDPYLTASPWVLVEEQRWRMWYVSGTGWRLVDGEPRHWYHIKYAESDDGIAWRRDGHVCIDYADEQEYAIARPCVVRDGDRYRMWFSSRGERYRIGYAESDDGLAWERLGPVEVEPGDWDSEMQAYPVVFDHAGDRYLLYNGNGYGATGVGYAVLD